MPEILEKNEYKLPSELIDKIKEYATILRINNKDPMWKFLYLLASFCYAKGHIMGYEKAVDIITKY